MNNIYTKNTILCTKKNKDNKIYNNNKKYIYIYIYKLVENNKINRYELITIH